MLWVRYPFYLVGKIAALAFIFVGGGFLAAVMLPIAMMVACDRERQTRRLIAFSFQFYIKAIQICGLIRLEVRGSSELSACGGKMIIANHPSLLDVVILMSLIPQAQCIIKHELWKHPFLGILMRRAGYIRNDLDPEELVAVCRRSLEEGRCLIIFPEGTRTVPGKMPVFQRGFANIATLTNAQIQPVLIVCDPPFLFKGDPWWSVPKQTPFFRVSLGEHLDASGYTLYGQRSINARKLVESLEVYYATQIGNSPS